MTEEKDKKMPFVEFPIIEMRRLIGSFTKSKLATFLDVTDLKADTQESKIIEIADLAKSLKCASVCVNPVEANDVLPKALKGSNVKECYVIDFPLGKLDIEMKAKMTGHVLHKSRELRGEGKGKIEFDMVINVGRFKTDPNYALEEINAVCDNADGETVKVIIRSAELTEKELIKACEIFAGSKAHFIKNSTGMDAYGALPEHIHIMRQAVGEAKGVKAAGGISDAVAAMRLFYAGANKNSLQNPTLFRIGTSSPINILSSFDNLYKSPEKLLQSSVQPCEICPFYYNARQKNEILQQEAINRCELCDYNY